MKLQKVDENTIRLKALDISRKVYSDMYFDKFTFNCPVGKDDPANALFTQYFQTQKKIER